MTMQLRIHGKNMQVTDWMESYVEKKLGKLDRYLPNIDETRVELTVEPTRNAGDSQICQVTIHTKGSILRAEVRSSDMRDSIDRVVDKMYRQVARYKGKRWNRGRGGQPAEVFGEDLPAEFMDEDEEVGGQIVRRKEFTALPMDEREAVEQMVLLGHDFFLFYNVDASQINVVYRRKDGNFGILQPRLT
jgi:putative sigma-54 modulation protein